MIMLSATTARQLRLLHLISQKSLIKHSLTARQRFLNLTFRAIQI